MKRRLRIHGSASGPALLLILLAAGGVWAVAQSYTAAGQRWWSHVEFLASPKLEGRLTGSPGYMKAADYMAHEFAAEGLHPAGVGGFFQPVQFVERTLDPAHSSLAVMGSGGKTQSLFPGSARLRPVGSPDQTVSAAAVFVGYGFSAPEAGYDDLHGVDLRGKIAVYVSGAPSSVHDPLRATLQSSGVRWSALRRAGAIGVIAISANARARAPRSRSSRAAPAPRPAWALADPQLREDAGMQLNASLSAEAAAPLFAGSGHSLPEIMAAAKQGAKLEPFPLPGKIHAQVAFTQRQITAPNVVGMLPGSDPSLRGEYVIVSAHLDHLGVRGGRLYPGALDNASGASALIEIAHDFKAAHAVPRRSVLFLAVGGEEEGELGSQYFASHPTVPASAIVADINMDMFLPLFPLHLLQVQGLQESTLGDDVRAAGRAVGVQIIADEEPKANRFIRSDQFSFIKKGIPALAFKFGYAAGSPQQKIYADWNRTRYHRPGDNLAQPNIDHAAAAKFCRLLYLLTENTANGKARPRWEPNSYFRRFATGRN